MANKLTVKVGSDTSELQKGLKQATRDIRDFEKSGSGAMNSLASAFGINVGKIQEMSTAFSGAAAKMAREAGASAGKITEIASAMGGIGAVAGTVVATVVAAWKQMDNSAQHYLNTLDGIEMAEGSRAYRDTYKNYIQDAVSGGAENAERVNKFREGWTRFTQGVALFAKAGTGVLGEKSAPQVMREAAEAAEKARGYQIEITAASRRQLEIQPKLLEIQAKINEDMIIARDTSISTADRREALQRIEGNIEQKYKLQRNDLNIIADRKKAINGLTLDEMKDLEGEIAAENAVVNLQVQESAERASIVRLTNSINRGVKELKTNVESVPSLNKILWNGDKSTDKTFDKLFTDTGISEAIAEAAADMEIDDIPIEIPFVPIIRTEDWQSMIQGAATDLATSFGTFIGAALSGDDGKWDKLGADLLSTIGSFAQRLGGLIMGIGTAQLALKESFATENPYVAIAAGAALVALGAAVTTMSSAAARGNYGSYATGTSYSSASGYTATNNKYTEREINIKVNGALTASGSTLVAVIKSEEDRKNKTT